MSESGRASFAAYDVEFVVESRDFTLIVVERLYIASTTQAFRPAADVELYSSKALYSSTALQRSTTLYILATHPPSAADDLSTDSV